MRKLKLQVQTSVDGFVAGPNGEMDWLTCPWDDELDQYVTQITESVGGILLGRRLAEGFIPHWGSLPDTEPGAAKINQTPKVVFTKTLETYPWDNTVLARGDLEAEVNRLKSEPGGDLIVYGGATFVSHLIQTGLIDTLYLFVNPVILGQGKPIFQSLAAKQNLTLQESKTFPCGIVVLCYQKS